MESNDQDRMAQGFKESGKALNLGKTNESQQGVGQTQLNIFMSLFTMGNWDLIQNFVAIVCKNLSDIIIKLIHRHIGESETNLLTPIFTYFMVILWAAIAELFNSFSFFTNSYVNYGAVLLLAKVYLIASIGQWVCTQWRRKFRPDWHIFTQDLGEPILYRPYVMLSNLMNLRVLSSFNFARYIESSLVITIGIIAKSVFYLPSLGNLLIACGASIYIVFEQRAKQFLKELNSLKDARIVQEAISNALKSPETRSNEPQSHLFDAVMVNSLVQAHQQNAEVDRELDELIKAQKLDG